MELKNTQKKLIDNISNNPQYTTIKPVDRLSEQFVTNIGSIWKENNNIKYLLYSIKQEIVKDLIEKEDAEKYKNQLIAIDKIFKVFEGYKQQYEAQVL